MSEPLISFALASSYLQNLKTDDNYPYLSSSSLLIESHDTHTVSQENIT